VKRALLTLLLATFAGCDAVVEPWQLDHDRIVAVRATPPRIAAGERSTLDTLIAHAGAPPAEEPPATATVASPSTLGDALAPDGDRWIVTAPAADRLAATRAALGLAPSDSIPLVVAVTSRAGFAATKTVWLGDTAANPLLDTARVAGVSPEPPLVVPRDAAVPLAIAVPATTDVTWLTSCGSLSDHDLPEAILHVEAGDPTDGQLALVVRTDDGGVAWQVWPIRAE